MTIYLDHAATTPVAPDVLGAMLPFLSEEYGNPSSPHSRGRAARAAGEGAREQVAEALGVTPLEVLFTSGGTESDHQAIKGVAWAARQARRGAHIVTTAIEHHAVLDSCRWLSDRQGFELTVLPPEPDGVVDPDRLLA
ncbi:MAG TPA: aminotransferase class V-fold PLP-dependent enzyme, partial [Egibacteraceae bacterium]|nr:aminotransferase class V-fold PLP-dependent enzyme [Egibacteraceae bacterium]